MSACHRFIIGYVREDGAAQAGQFLAGAKAGGLVPVQEDNLATLFQETFGGGKANPARSAGNQNPFVVQAAHEKLLSPD
jgi:hypothetical protein